MAGSHCSADRSVPRAFAQSHRRKNTYVRRVHTQLAHALPPGHMARTVPLFSSGGEETRGLRRVLKIPTTSSSLHNTRFPRVLLVPSVALFPSLVGPNSPPWRRPLKPALRPAVQCGKMLKPNPSIGCPCSFSTRTPCGAQHGGLIRNESCYTPGIAA